MAIWRIDKCKNEAGYRSHASIYGLIRVGLWTQPVKIGERSSGWPDDEVKAINAARIAGASDEQIRELVKQLHAKRAEKLALLMAAGLELADQEPDLERGGGSLSLVKTFLEHARTLLPKRLENPFFHSWYRGFSFFAEAFARPEAMRENLERAVEEARFVRQTAS